MIRLLSLEIRNYRSIQRLDLNDLPEVVLLYGDNDVGKSNLVEAAGTFLKLASACLSEAPTWTWSAAVASTQLGDNYPAFFPYGEHTFRLGGQIDIESRLVLFRFVVSRAGEDLRVERLEPDDDLLDDSLTAAFSHPWALVGGDRRLTTEVFPIGVLPHDRPVPLPDGSDLKLQLLLASQDSDLKRRRLYREHFLRAFQEGPFSLPRLLPALQPDGRIELLFESEEGRLEDRGTGPQHWALTTGILFLSEASVLGIEEPEAHLSWDAQSSVLRALGEFVGSPHGPRQLFVATHSPLTIELSSLGQWYEVRREGDAGTKAEHRHRESLSARFPPAIQLTDQPLRMWPQGLLKLRGEDVDYLGARTGDNLYCEHHPDGSLRLYTAARLGALLSSENEGK